MLLNTFWVCKSKYFFNQLHFHNKFKLKVLEIKNLEAVQERPMIINFQTHSVFMCAVHQVSLRLYGILLL